MPFNGSGTYTAPANSWNPAVSSTAVNSADWNTLLADLETALSGVVTKDGQTTATARIPFASGISVGDGSVTAPAVNFSADTNTGLYRIGADNLGVAIAGAKAAEFDSSGNLVLNSKNLTGVADFTATGTLTLPAGGIETADLADNLVTLAKLADQTQGDVLYYGASGAPAVLSAGTAEYPLVTKGAGADPVFQQLATAGIADTAVTEGKVADSAITLAKQADMAAERLQGRAVGAGTGAPQALTAAQALAVLGYESATSTGNAIPAAAGAVTFAHGLSAKPNDLRVVLRCTTADLNFSIGDEVDITSHMIFDGTSEFGAMCYSNATNVVVKRGPNDLNIYDASTGNISAIDTADWVIDIDARILP